MIGTGDIVADGFRRMRADENRAGIADALDIAVGVGGGDFQMLGRQAIDQRDRVVEFANGDDGAEVAP